MPLPARPVSFPPYQLKTLPNGLQVLVIPWHEQPSVSMRLIIKAGAAQDPAEKPGVASLVAALLNQGTATKSAGGKAIALSGDLEAAVRLAGTRSAEEEVEDEIRDLKARTQREVGR